MRAALLSRYLVDALAILTVTVLLCWASRLTQAFACLVAILGLFTFVVQFQSLRFSNQLFSVVALENTDHIAMIANNTMMIGLAAFLAYALLMTRFVMRGSQTSSIRTRLVLLAVLLLSAIAIRNDHKWLPSDVVTTRATYYNSRDFSHFKHSLLSEFWRVLTHQYRMQRRIDQLGDTTLILDERLRKFVAKHSLSWGKFSAEYPLLHLTKTSERLDGLSSKPFPAAPNVIVIFAEGLSARTIQPYSNKFPNISDNIAEFAEQAIKFDHYYNHTFATYRALAGQNCSFFPAYRTEAEVRYRCLPHILKDSGYQTEFLISQKKDATDLDEMLSRVGFDSVLAYEELEPMLTHEPTLTALPTHLSDAKLFATMVERLKQRHASIEQNKKPLYLGVYNFETHTNNHPMSPVAQYEAAPNNYVLNTIHGFDKAFGLFWDYFKTSPYADNTILILTSDHAHYPDNDYRSLWSPEDRYSPVFMDRIPLLIYSPFHEQVAKFKIRRSSSLDFAPSILHLLGINRYQSPFLGHSLFDSTPRMRPIAMSNQDAWYTARGLPQQLTTEEPNPNYESMRLFIKRTQALELKNKLWPAKVD
ncbi:LTA synthase family protein [Arenicella xantha]|uniref:Sulfatase-like protein n=1 Tax=Arenicella xantha TaxID=644221 RepID=A0A395JPM4_9GAMM|nr:LTA synthase family protein [Arenicella xantha]RBP53447.1 sulfatase-like protein [Arenicella xantha]